jgi:hypothetical protein
MLCRGSLQDGSRGAYIMYDGAQWFARESRILVRTSEESEGCVSGLPNAMVAITVGQQGRGVLSLTPDSERDRSDSPPGLDWLHSTTNVGQT